MDFKQRALKSITRRKGKSLILFFVVFILGNVIAGAVAIQQSTVNVEKETKRSMGAVTSVQMDYEAYDKKMSNVSEEEMMNMAYPQPPKAKVYREIGDLSYVKRYDLFLTTGTGTVKLKSATDDNVGYGGTPYMFNIKGFNQKEFLDVTEGLVKITQGEGFTDNDIKNGTNAAIISLDVAEANSLSVGDSFVLDATNQVMDDSVEAQSSESGELPQPKTVSFDFPMKVSGIFTVVKKDPDAQQSQEQAAENQWRALEQLNTIYTTEGAARDLSKKLGEAYSSGTDAPLEDMEDNYQATYVLNSPDDIEAFREDANALLPEYYQVIASSDQYDQVAGGLNKLNTISKYVVIVAVIATLLILSLVVLLFMRDRKHELGIYLSFGESRGKVITQIVLELLMISSIALVLSLITGNFLGGAISQSLIQSDWISNSSQEGMVYYGNNLMQNNLSFMDIQQAYKVTFSIGYIVTYLLVGVGTVLLSAVLPLLYILRLNPKKIMM
ncbi:FtsX-like permease family protein [Enterococcus sp. 669A]|uniref:FtsX-like permease family protein n=1 Tax=Candidatus Enterococcus moelleringii TaxID=2815325 RepID=A0ABS3LGB9_9ENTE|nr:ABC transporter permease [Enterococcus sp. 669A]MBO1308684.1 FtsX-like permease family protein [Enterococcus sp. 669A]